MSGVLEYIQSGGLLWTVVTARADSEAQQEVVVPENEDLETLVLDLRHQGAVVA